MINAICQAAFSLNDMDPDHVVVGETRSYSFEKVQQAVKLVLAGAKLVGANPALIW